MPWTRAQSKTLGSADIMGSTVGRDWSHLVEQSGYAGKCTGVLTKHVPRAVLDTFAGMVGYTFLGEETAKFQTYTSISQNYWDQRAAAVEKTPCPRR